MTTKEKILQKALEMFNDKGIEYVGVRELAGLLNMRVSNITYYFPTKDDLVYQLSMELNELNSRIVVVSPDRTLLSFFEMLYQVFVNHVKYRCLLLSFVHLMEQNKAISAQYKNTQKDRNSALKSNIDMLISSGYLEIGNDKDTEYLVSTLSLIIRFWISEAAVSYSRLSVEMQIGHYLKVILKLLSKYATPKALAEINEFDKWLISIQPQVKDA